MAKRDRKLTKGERVGLDALDGLRELKRGGGVVYRVKKSRQTTAARRRAA